MPSYILSRNAPPTSEREVHETTHAPEPRNQIPQVSDAMGACLNRKDINKILLVLPVFINDSPYDHHEGRESEEVDVSPRLSITGECQPCPTYREY